jgi:hypothetical protein
MIINWKVYDSKAHKLIEIFAANEYKYEIKQKLKCDIIN